MEWKKRLKDALYISLGLFLIGILLLDADVTDTIDKIRGIYLPLLLLVLVLYVMNTCVKILRWYTLIKGMGANDAGWITVPIFLSSLALNNSTPGKVGGEPVRALMLKEHTGTSISRGIASIFAEKSLDILTILSLAVIGLVYLVIELGFRDVEGMVYAIGAGGVLMVVLIGFIFSRRASGLMTKIIEWAASKGSGGNDSSVLFKLAARVKGSIGRFQESLGNLRRNRYSSIAAVLLTISIWMNEALRLYLIVIALPGNYHVPFIGAVAAVSVANILGFILPMGGGNFIGNDSVLLLLTGEKLLSRPASMTAVATSIWISIPLGLLSLMYLRKRSKRKEVSD